MRTAVQPRAVGIALSLLAVTVLSACGAAAAGYGGTPATGAPATASPVPMTMPASSQNNAATAPVATTSVAIHGFAFAPQVITVKVGTTVTWTQQDEDSHTVTADDKSFTSDALANGQTYTHTFSAAGTYAYHCSIHPFMQATVVVTNG
jgi:plastocyanin